MYLVSAWILPLKNSFSRDHKLRSPDGGKRIYSCNKGNSIHWDEPIKNAVEICKVSAEPYAAQYVGSMVTDIYSTILYGGIYLYPANAKLTNGKLRMLYEGIPMAMIIEQAGGIASTGLFQCKIQRILDLVPDDIHCKCPIIMGGARDVQVIFDQYMKGGIEAPKLL